MQYKVKLTAFKIYNKTLGRQFFENENEAGLAGNYKIR